MNCKETLSFVEKLIEWKLVDNTIINVINNINALSFVEKLIEWKRYLSPIIGLSTLLYISLFCRETN